MFEDLDIDIAACDDPAAYGINSQGNPRNEELSKLQEALTSQGNIWYEQPYRPTQNQPTPSHLKSTYPGDASPAAVIFDMNLGVDSIDSHEYSYCMYIVLYGWRRPGASLTVYSTLIARFSGADGTNSTIGTTAE